MAVKTSTSIQKQECLLALLLFFILFIFQTKTINTGDAGELVSASFGLGIAHPSGYPVYLVISKLFTFIPFGNIPTKVALVSSFSSSLLFLVGIKLLKRLTDNKTSMVFLLFLLISSYSFFCQSLLAKFYPLNTLLIAVIFFLGLDSIETYKLKNQLLISFLLGIALGLHQTTFLMFIPLLFLVIIHFKDFIKNLPLSLFLFFVGATVVLYLMIRSWKPTLLNMSPSGDLHSLIHTLLRKSYGNSSSDKVAESLLFLNIHKVWYATRNISNFLLKQFFWYSTIFLIFGFTFLFKLNKRIFIFFLLTFLSYSVILAYLTLSEQKPDINSWYIAANQYYLPLLFFYALLCAIGFSFLINLLPKNLKPVSFLFMILPLIYFPQNLFLNFYDKNNVAYLKTVDELFVKPVKSIVIFSGDNDVFQGWYMKNVEKFRDDICLLSAPTIRDKIWGIRNGCIKNIYEKAYPFVFTPKPVLNMADFNGYIRKKRVYSSMPIENNKILSKYLNSYFNILDFLIENKKEHLKGLKEWLYKNRLKYYKFLHFNACLTHSTDDVFTKALCDKYANYLVFLAHDIGEKSKKGKKSLIRISFQNKTYKLSILTNKKNEYYLWLAYKILEYNKLNDYYLLKGF